MKLPTVLAKQMLGDAFKARMENPVDMPDAVAAFQRMSLVAELSDAVLAVKPWFKPDCRVISDNSPDMASMIAYHAVAKHDILGQAVDAIVGVMTAGLGSTKDKLAAAAILNELYGEKQIISDQVLTDKLVIDLVGGTK